MSFVMDHLAAILVGSTLLGALLFVQMRQQQGAIETTVRENSQLQAAEFLSSFQRDLENLRTHQQAEHALGRTRLALDVRETRDRERYTALAAFPTLADPALGSASPIALVHYVAWPTGDSVRVGDVHRQAIRVERHMYTRGGGSTRALVAENVIDFDVIFVFADGREESEGNALSSATQPAPVAVKVALMAAQAGPGQRAGDQRTTGTGALTRRTSVVRVLGAGATEGLPPVETGPSGIPDVPPNPSDPPPPPPPPPGSSPPPGPSPTPRPPTPRPPSGPPAPPPPPPTYPSPPPGSQI